MTNTYTITTDDADYARAVIAILDCLQGNDVVEDDAIDSIVFLLSMCLDLSLKGIKRESLLHYAKCLTKAASDLVAYANEEIEQ